MTNHLGDIDNTAMLARLGMRGIVPANGRSERDHRGAAADDRIRAVVCDHGKRLEDCDREEGCREETEGGQEEGCPEEEMSGFVPLYRNGGAFERTHRRVAQPI